MLKRHVIVLLGMLLSPAALADDVAVSIGIGTPHASIGIHVGEYPRLVAIPGYPVYYAPRLRANFFFYDGMYWVFHHDNWYASYWYNGPWWYVSPVAVPVYILRVPVRYYRYPPPYFRGWRRDGPPHWGDHWGHDWERRRDGWDRWNYRAVPPLAPLPAYQRRYSGDSYPRQVERQRELRQQHYRYQPRDPVVRQHDQRRYQAPPGQRPQGRDANGRGRDQERGRGRPPDKPPVLNCIRFPPPPGGGFSSPSKEEPSCDPPDCFCSPLRWGFPFRHGARKKRPSPRPVSPRRPH